MTARLQQYQKRLLPAIEAEMKTALAVDKPGYERYYGMMHYHLGWVDRAFKTETTPAGKRIRPLVCLLVCEAAGGDWQRALPAAAAIELLHNFSLIHDDIEDCSHTRRRRETVWTLWGVPQAINAGDSMFSAAFDALSRLVDRGATAETTLEALNVFARACIQLTKGQHLDMWFENQPVVSVEQYLEMISGKTAALISATAEMGAVVACAPGHLRQHYAAFGRNVGLAFQAYDDILGVWGDEALVGKSAASDILARKKTLPVLYGLTASSELRQLYAEPEIELSRAVRLLDSVGAREYTLQAALKYTRAALKHLALSQAAGTAGEALQLLTAELLQRQS